MKLIITIKIERIFHNQFFTDQFLPKRYNISEDTSMTSQADNIQMKLLNESDSILDYIFDQLIEINEQNSTCNEQSHLSSSQEQSLKKEQCSTMQLIEQLKMMSTIITEILGVLKKLNLEIKNAIKTQQMFCNRIDILETKIKTFII